MQVRWLAKPADNMASSQPHHGRAMELSGCLTDWPNQKPLPMGEQMRVTGDVIIAATPSLIRL